MSLPLRSMITGRSGSVGRYAPSPSGPQHLGNLRTALVAWLQTRLEGGVFIVRMEDLDSPRVRAGSAESIHADLNWLGLDVDEGSEPDRDSSTCVQSERLELYAMACAQLTRSALTFDCFCSRKDIREAASAPHGPQGLIYPGTCRHGVRDPGDRSPALRLRVDNEVITFDDVVAGFQHADLARVSGDFVIRRADAVFAYQLAVAVDDALMGVTDVVRGDDLLESTARQIYVLNCLDLPVPRYWHVPVLRDASGQRLAKRDGSESLESRRQQGQRPNDVIGELAFDLGLIPVPGPISALQLLESLTTEHFVMALKRCAANNAS